MFDFFKKKPPLDPPTEKQIRYANKLGIAITPNMSKSEVSDAIGAAESANPQLTKNRKRVNEKVRARTLGPELIAEEAHWSQFSEGVEYMLAIYRDRKGIVVDVLRVNEAFVNSKGKLILGVDRPKVVKDRHIGDHLEWDGYFELPRTNLLRHEPLHREFHSDGNDAYAKVVRRGLKLAQSL